MNKNRQIFSYFLLPITCFLLVLTLGFATPAPALELYGNFKQGGLVIGHEDPGFEAFLDDIPLQVGPDGRFVFGFGREAGPGVTLRIVYADGKVSEQTFDIEARVYDIERIDGLPPKTVIIPEEEKIRREKETAMVRTARAGSSNDLDWAEGFIFPAEGRISGVYGSQRILNGEPRWPHFGLDIAAPVGTPVMAPAGGVVRLAEEDFLLEGGIIIIDHGFGVSSTLMHLSSVEVTTGQRVKRGEVIAGLGATGRVSGPHVDWRINWGPVRLDPALALDMDALEF